MRDHRTTTNSALLPAIGLLLAIGNVAAAQGATPAELISQFRLQHGEGRVTPDPALDRIAQQQARAMAAKNLLDHDVLGPFNARVASSGSERAAENIAYGYDNFARTLGQWIDSSGHRKNLLLHDASRVGVGSAKTPTGRIYWTMVIAGGYKNAEPKGKKGSPARSKSASVKQETQRKDCRISLLGLCL